MDRLMPGTPPPPPPPPPPGPPAPVPPTKVNWVRSLRLQKPEKAAVGFVSQKVRVGRSCIQHASSVERCARLGSFRQIPPIGQRLRNLGSFVAFSNAAPEAVGFVPPSPPPPPPSPPGPPPFLPPPLSSNSARRVAAAEVGFVRRGFAAQSGGGWVRSARFTPMQKLIDQDGRTYRLLPVGFVRARIWFPQLSGSDHGQPTTDNGPLTTDHGQPTEIIPTSYYVRSLPICRVIPRLSKNRDRENRSDR